MTFINSAAAAAKSLQSRPTLCEIDARLKLVFLLRKVLLEY